MQKFLFLRRFTMGQARQEELIDSFLDSDLKEDGEFTKNLFMNLSPYCRTDAVRRQRTARKTAAKPEMTT